MLLEFVFGLMLFLPVIYGNNLTLKNSETRPNGTMSVYDDASNKTKITLVTEGGAITQINTNLTLPNINNTILMDLDKELGTPKNRPIVARKGVKSEEFVDNRSTAVNSTEIMEHQVIPDNQANNTVTVKNHTIIANNSRMDTTAAVVNEDISVKKVKTPHKPQVLSYDNLSGTNHDAQNIAKTSSKTFVSDQIPNPNADNAKSQNIDGNQPGMIMPVVITILIVPLFAVLGYMAMRRGQEAWKNRHYKRMDFLLDGMYND